MTDREDQGDKDPKNRFGSRPSFDDPRTVCGHVEYSPVLRPPGTHYDGSIKLGPDKLPDGQDACVNLVIDAVRKSGRSRVLLFIHGYNNTFDFAVRRAITSAVDIGYDGVFLVWSWPSDGYAKSYVRDQNTARRSVRRAVRFVQALLDRKEIQRFDMVAHSMGNRIAIEVLDDVSRKQPAPTNLGTMVFAAADEDRDLFRDVINDLRKENPNLGGIRTVYAATYDHPLQISSLVNDYVPLGLGKQMFVHDGVETVDATEVEGGYWGSFTTSSHAHVFSVPKAIADLKNLLMGGKRAGERGLTRREQKPVPYWVIPN